MTSRAMLRYRQLPKALRRVLVVAVVLALLAGAWFTVQIQIEKRIARMLENTPVLLAEGVSCKTSIRKVRINLSRMGVSLYDLRVTAPAKRRTADGPTPILKASIPKITVSGIRIAKDAETGRRHYRIRNVAILNPNVLFEGCPGPHIHDTLKSPAIAFPVTIDNVSLREAALRISFWRDNERNVFSAEGLSIAFHNFAARDSLAIPLTPPDLDQLPAPATLTAGSTVSVYADALSYTFKNGALRMEVDTLALDTEAGRFSAARIAQIPQYDKTQYTLRVGDRSDWVTWDVRHVVCDSLAIPSFEGDDDLLRIGSVAVDSLTIDAYKDRNQKQSDAIRPTLYGAVQQIPAGITIPRLRIGDINIRYEEVSRGSTASSVIALTSMKTEIVGLTNRPARPDETYTLTADGLLFGTTPMHAVLTLPASPANDRFTLTASMAPFHAPEVSPITEPLANIKILSGQLHSASVVLSGDSQRATSTVNMTYDNLQIAILKKRDPMQERELLTNLANGLVLRRSNPERGVLRTGEGTHRRDEHKSFWNYIWKTAFAGVVDLAM